MEIIKVPSGEESQNIRYGEALLAHQMNLSELQTRLRDITESEGELLEQLNGYKATADAMNEVLQPYLDKMDDFKSDEELDEFRSAIPDDIMKLLDISIEYDGIVNGITNNLSELRETASQIMEAIKKKGIKID
ncbi:MAG: hypothetical protein Q8P30_02030 [Candidatus Uhrbacteria bacterium]|nr:hypothetical protein [Candidatus Uhrbacteria bacterium]